mgnify:CR=1 FL=1
MAYTTIDNPELYFQCKNYVGSSSAQSITLDGSEDMQPDFIWFKNRETSSRHQLYDSVRGATKLINSDDDDAEQTVSYFTSFDSDGFTIPSGSSALNGGSQNIIAWCWKAGTSFSNDASSTGVGTIDSSGSVSDTAGFSIIIRTGTASAGTIKHGLSTTPKMIITKMRNATESWGIYHVGIGNTKYLKLDVNDAEDSSSVVWNNTTPTASVFSVGSSALVNGSGKTYVDYIFSEVKGYSKFGSYTGNGNADGPFVYTGFRPAWILYKNTARSISWLIHDNKRLGYNPDNDEQHPDTTAADGSDDRADILSNGFKIRESSNLMNVSGEQVIYMAFAESPFVNSNGVPNNAR